MTPCKLLTPDKPMTRDKLLTQDKMLTPGRLLTLARLMTPNTLLTFCNSLSQSEPFQIDWFDVYVPTKNPAERALEESLKKEQPGDSCDASKLQTLTHST